ncbi:MAG: DUF6077 domain-containing protein [Marvinbryantia sp.]|jgi:hypothetical protein
MVIFIKSMAALVLLFVAPFLMGSLLLSFFNRKQSGFAARTVTGYLLMFSIFEILTVPLTILRVPYHVLVWIAGIIYVVLCLLSIWKYRGDIRKELLKAFNSSFWQPWTMYAALSLVILQAAAYVFFMTTDLDDAYYVAAATTAIHYDTLYLNSPYTGMSVETLNLRYVLSPFPMFLAFISTCTGIEPAVMAHTVLPAFLIMLAYMVYYLLGGILFTGKQPDGIRAAEKREQTRQIGLFLVLLSLIHIYSYYSIYTQGTFLLIRIWQGKAVLASILLPCLFCMGYKALTGYQEKGDWFILFLCAVSCTMVSSMGVALAPVLLGILALLFGVFKGKWRYVMNMILCCLPCALIGALYLILKVIQKSM